MVKVEGLIQFRDIFSEEVIEYYVSDKELEVVDIPTGYTHNMLTMLRYDYEHVGQWVYLF